MCRQPLALVSSLKMRRETTIMKTKEVEEDNEKASKKVEKEEECDEY